MKVFFDESGQTGCVVPNKKGYLYRKNQRFFVLAGIVCQNDEEVKLMSDKYMSFLRKYGVSDREFKGTELLKPENRRILDDFIENMMDDTHMFLCCYDKIFYLASMISMYFLGRETMIDQPLLYFRMQSALARENQRIFIEFCNALEDGSAEARRSFVKYMSEYPYEKIDLPNNIYVMAAGR